MSPEASGDWVYFLTNQINKSMGNERGGQEAAPPGTLVQVGGERRLEGGEVRGGK